MTSPRDTLEAIARAIANAGELPAELSVLLQEADTNFEDADIDLPLLEIQLTSANSIVLNNSDFVGFKTDASGNRIGRVYGSSYEMEIEFSLWTVKDDGYDPDTLGEMLRTALFKYSSYGPEQSFTDSDGDAIEDINYFRLGDGGREDDLLQTPTVRKWTQTAEVWACEQFSTDEDYIVSVNAPDSDGFSDTNDDGTIDNLNPDKNV